MPFRNSLEEGEPWLDPEEGRQMIAEESAAQWLNKMSDDAAARHSGIDDAFARRLAKERELGRQEGKGTNACDAYEQGLADGMALGMNKGIEKGQQKGLEKVLNKGQHKGFQEGTEFGFGKGKEKGLEKGQHKGIKKGTKLGFGKGWAFGRRLANQP